LTGIVLQARLDSSRLRGKALLPIDGKPVIYRVMEALNFVPADLRILACPEDAVTTFKPLCEKCGFFIFAGPKDDVLERFYKVIRHFSLKRVIRATGDNPFVFADAALSINNEACALNADYAGYSELPYGAGVESISAGALLLAQNEAVAQFDREHVCPYLYNNPQKFNIHRPVAPQKWRYPDIRLTIDTRDDYENAVKLYDVLKNDPDKHNGNNIINTHHKLNLGE